LALLTALSRDLDAGEAASIALALEISADLILFVEADRLFRFQDLFCRAAEALEDRRAAASWLGRASPRFSDLAPLEYASTEPGYQELLQVIECIADDSFG